MYYTEILLDDPCMETGSFDVAYLTEVDPTWSDDDLTMLLEPETYLFGSPVAQAACAGDCVLSSLGFGSNLLFWCAGCNGSIYPFNGHVQAHVSAVQASSLLVERMTAKLHREGLMWGTTGDGAMCGYYLQPGDGQDAVQVHDALPGRTDRRNQWPMLPALRPHVGSLGRRQDDPVYRRGLRLRDLPQAQLLPGRQPRRPPQ